MIRFRSAWAHRLPLVATLALLCCAISVARAQRGGGGGGGMRGGGPGMADGSNGTSGDFSRDREGSFPGNSPEGNANSSILRPGLQLGPPGRWWDDKHFAKQLQLRPDQQRQMDATFESNRSVLLKRYGDLQGEQSRMEALTRAKTLDEGALFAQIDRIAQARADLEKATTHYLLQIRGTMDADQLARLEQHR